MPSSTSNFDRRLPAQSALLTLIVALSTLLLSLAGAEWAMARRGYVATAIDSPELWLRERQWLADHPSEGIAILGSSRAQIGIDLDTLAGQEAGTPVQLAIDNGSFMPVLAGLADDPKFAGMVIVDFLERYLPPGSLQQTARAYESRFQQQRGIGHFSPSARAEAWLGDHLRSRLRIYADGGQPLSNLLLRAFNSDASPQYMQIRPDRSRIADYSRLDMPAFYYRTVARYFDWDIQALPWARGMAAVEAELRARIARLPPADPASLLTGIATATRLADRIEARGGRVVFVRMPSCGLLLEAEQRLYPRDRYWAALAAINPNRTVHFADYPELRGVACPDGSHIDRSEVAAFTRDLWRIVHSLR